MNLIEVLMHYLAEPDIDTADAFLVEVDVDPTVALEIRATRGRTLVKHLNTYELIGGSTANIWHVDVRY